MQDHAFIARQPIVDKQQKIVAYELLFRHNNNANPDEVNDELEAGSKVLANALNHMGTQWVLGDKQAFINISAPMLESNFLDLLPPEQVVLEIPKRMEPTLDLLQRINELRAQGFQFAVDDENTPLLELASYVKIDVQALGPQKTAERVQSLVQFPGKLIAQKVESQAEFKACKELNFTYFQGFHFAHPETLSAKVINPGHASVLDVLNKVRNNVDAKEIELAFKRDVALSFKLLRYINSVGFGLSCEIQSIRHAISILGYQQLYRWLTLLLATAGGDSTSPALMKTAVTRGRITELLGQGYLERQDQDNLFIVGVFSMLDVMLEMPMEAIMEKLLLPEPIVDALLHRTGVYGPFLEVTEACESMDYERIESLAFNLQLSPEQINKAHVAALAWVEELGI
jgi:EAL and modified HD-GYP domain-containing signal transduction protein